MSTKGMFIMVNEEVHQGLDEWKMVTNHSCDNRRPIKIHKEPNLMWQINLGPCQCSLHGIKTSSIYMVHSEGTFNFTIVLSVTNGIHLQNMHILGLHASSLYLNQH